MSFIIEGNDYMPPVSGGYLIVKIDGDEFDIVSVPSPILGADRHRASVTENFDHIEDKEGNQFSIIVWSSNVGVNWKISITASDIEKEKALKERIDVKYQANDF